MRYFKDKVVFLNPRTCGIYKSGGVRYKVDIKTGHRSTDIDNEMLSHVEDYLNEKDEIDGMATVAADVVESTGVLVPRYYDQRFKKPYEELAKHLDVESISIGELETSDIISVTGGHGSPSNDQRMGDIPYIKVSDIRNLRINVNPTNMIPRPLVEQQYWRGKDSKIRAWDLITANRASSNIGEFAIILPGEEQIVLTKEVFIIRLKEKQQLYTPFYLLWAFSLSAVRLQWQRVTLMQTNREDVHNRYREILIPKPPSETWARNMEKPFRAYFEAIANAKTAFIDGLQASNLEYIASARRVGMPPSEEEPQALEELSDDLAVPEE